MTRNVVMAVRKRTPLDFEKIEALRYQMGLTTTGMARALGVSRMTYYSWVKGSPLRRSSEEDVKKKIKALLAVVTETNWPTKSTMDLSSSARAEHVLALMRQYE